MKHFARALDGTEQSIFGLTAWQPRSFELESREPTQGEEEPNDGAEDSDPMPQLENLGLELLVPEAGDVEGDDFRWLSAGPSPGSGAWNPETGGECHVAGLVDELMQPVVVPVRGPAIEHGGAS